MKRDWLRFGIMWAILIAGGEAVIGRIPILPPEDAREAVVSDHAFKVLSQLAVPVFAFIAAFLLFALFRWRSRTGPAMPEDGPAIKGSTAVYAVWLAITGGLAILLIIYPGLTGLAEIRGTQRADLVVNVTGVQWAWTVAYPDRNVVSTEELVLPVGQRVRFDVTSKDVIHSFWIPAFRMKIDAVPGLTTNMYVTPSRIDSYVHDPSLRVQCAELCGLAHATMSMPVRVVSAREFDAWLLQAKEHQQQGAQCSPSGTTLSIAAKDVQFDTTCLAVSAGTPSTITFDNNDAGIPHNVAIYRDKTASVAVLRGAIVTGVVRTTYHVPALQSGTYLFRCDVHPNTMLGTFRVP